MRHPAALASLCNQWRILQTSQPRSSAPSQLVTRRNLTHSKQAVVTNHIVLVNYIYVHTCTCTRIIVCTTVHTYFTILDLETTLDLWLEERPRFNFNKICGQTWNLLDISEERFRNRPHQSQFQ